MAIQTYQAKITNIKKETATVKTYTFDLGGEIDFLPGQFVIIEFVNRLPGIKRSYSISSSPTQKNIIILTIKKAGVFTTELDNVSVGEQMVIKGPFGHFVLNEEMKEDLVFVAGGAGITPFHSMLKYMTEKRMPNKANLFYSCRTTDEFIFYDELTDIETKNKNICVYFTATRCEDPNWKGFRERINEEMIKKKVKDYKKCIYYLCGPMPMVEGIEKLLQQIGIDKTNIKTEKWGT